MSNGTGFLDEVAELISVRKKQLDKFLARSHELEAEIEALEAAARIYREEHSITEAIESKSPKGKTQIQALLTIARASNGIFKANEAKRVMIEAGLISNPKNAASIVYTLIKNHEHLFEKVEPGVY